jgi:formate--tetrahydrofolate ligase
VDLGGRRIIKKVSRKAGFHPDVVVMVATVRSLKMNGGLGQSELDREDLGAVTRGLANLKRHIENVRSFGLPVVVALNRFIGDTAAEVTTVIEKCSHLGVSVIESTVWEDGSKGGIALAEAVVKSIDTVHSDFQLLYDDDLPLWQKIERIAQRIYGARDLQADKRTRNKIKRLEKDGYRRLPVCMAKTQYSFSSDPKLLGAPTNFDLTIRDVRLAAGAEFVIVYCGDVMTMPGLPKRSAAESIDIDAEGRVTGLF